MYALEITPPQLIHLWYIRHGTHGIKRRRGGYKRDDICIVYIEKEKERERDKISHNVVCTIIIWYHVIFICFPRNFLWPILRYTHTLRKMRFPLSKSIIAMAILSMPVSFISDHSCVHTGVITSKLYYTYL